MADQKQLVEKLCRCIKGVHTTFYNTISDTVNNNMEKFCKELFSKRVISSSVMKSMNYSKVIDEFWAGLVWKKSVKDIESHCEAFLQSLVVIGPNGEGAAQTLREDWTKEIKREMGISFLSGNKNEAVIAAALAKGKGNLFQSTIILHGPPGAGKSSLKRLILGLDPPTKEEQKSTDIMEKGVRAVLIDRMNEFQIIENDELITRLAGEVNNHQSKEPMTKPVGIFEHEAITSTSNDYDDFVPVPNISSDSVKAIIERLDQALVPIKIYDTRWHHVVDSGGQPQFLDILPLVYRTPPSINIVVIRLTDDLKGKQRVCFYEDGENVYTLPDHLSLTNLEFITNVCQIASLHHSSATEGSVKPHVMIVGTHLDELGESAAEKVRKFNDGLSQIQKKFIGVLICKDGKDNIIFPFNTMIEKGHARQKYTKEIQDCISNVTSKKENVPSIEVPLRWFAYELEIDKDEGVMSVYDCEEKGKPLRMNSVDVENALMFLNKSALLLYYPDEDLVLTKMDPLVGQLSALIKASFKTSKNDTIEKNERLRTKGLFDKSFLDEVLSNFKDRRLNIDKFLKVLEHLKIIISVGNEYFLPSALSLEPNESQLPLEDTTASPLVFGLLDDHTDRDHFLILPHGFFFTVAIEFLSCNDGKYKFQLYGGTDSDVGQLRSEIRIMEADGKIPGVITLTNRIKWIKVTSNTVTPEADCPIIYKIVDAAINRTLKRFKLTTPYISANVCPLCPHTEEHYCQLSPDGRSITCKRSGKPDLVTKEISYWFKDPSTLDSQATTRSAVQQHINLDIDDFNEVYDCCRRRLTQSWKRLAINLRLDRPDVETIQHDCRTADDCLQSALAAWLKRSSPNQLPPSWRSLCDAVHELDGLLSDKIWRNHTCTCDLCSTHTATAPAINDRVSTTIPDQRSEANYSDQELERSSDQTNTSDDSSTLDSQATTGSAGQHRNRLERERSSDGSVTQATTIILSDNAQLHVTGGSLNKQSIHNAGPRLRSQNTTSSNTTDSSTATASSNGGKKSKESTDGHESVEIFGLKLPKWLLINIWNWCNNNLILSCVVFFLVVLGFVAYRIYWP